MKSIKWAFLALTLITFTLSSCKKSSNSKPASNSVSLKFNGTAYNTTSNITGAVSKGALQIVGAFNTTTTVYIVVTGGLAVGSFDIASGAGAATFSTGASNDYIADSGTITITSLTSTTIAGTFQFDGTDAISGIATCTVTNGTFNTSYTTTP
jgi:hypothetical protein